MFLVINNINKVRDNLSFGAPPDNLEASRYKYIFCLKGRPDYYCQEATWLTVFPFDDDDGVENMPPEDELHELAQLVNKRSKQGPTLVHCSAGLNRSGLITALALMYDGMTAEQAIALLRRKRCDEVLHNDTFREWLSTTTLRQSEP